MILTSNVYAPDGELLRRGRKLPSGLDKRFRADIADYLVADDAHPLLTLPVDTEEDLEAAWRTVHDHDPAADPIVSVAADRVRAAARDLGAHRIARLRPFRDIPAADPTPSAGRVTLKGSGRRSRTSR